MGERERERGGQRFAVNRDENIDTHNLQSLLSYIGSCKVCRFEIKGQRASLVLWGHFVAADTAAILNHPNDPVINPFIYLFTAPTVRICMWVYICTNKLHIQYQCVCLLYHR